MRDRFGIKEHKGDARGLWYLTLDGQQMKGGGTFGRWKWMNIWEAKAIVRQLNEVWSRPWKRKQ